MAKQIEVFKTPDDLALNAARMFIRAADEAIRERGRFVVALAGGSTPEKTYTILASHEFSSLIDWDKVYLFFGDERFVPLDDERSNFALVHRTLLSQINIPKDNIFAVPVDCSTPDEAAQQYAATLANFFGSQDPPRFDLILLGLGDDGHTASLFPGMPSLAAKEWVVASPPGVLPPPVERVSFTYHIINAAREIAFFVAGEKKAQIVHEVIDSGIDIEKYPATGVLPNDGKLTWMLDEAAAKLLDKSA